MAGRTGSQREAVLICYLIAGAMGLASVFVTQATVIEGYVVGGLALLAGLVGLWKMEKILHESASQRVGESARQSGNEAMKQP